MIDITLAKFKYRDPDNIPVRGHKAASRTSAPAKKAKGRQGTGPRRRQGLGAWGMT